MATREDIRTREDVDEADVDDVVGLAAQLQQAAGAEDDRASVAEVKDVARELDIAPQFVEQAIAKLKGDREAAARAQVQARSRAITAGAVAVAVLMLSALGVSGVGLAGRAAVLDAAHVAEQQESDLIGVLDRQRSLVPQIAALAGAEVAAPTVPSDATVADRLAAAEALNAEMTRAFAALPPATDDGITQQRLNLQYEIVGAQNRIDVERKRWEEARRAWESAAESPSGRVAVVLGMAPAPR